MKSINYGFLSLLISFCFCFGTNLTYPTTSTVTDTVNKAPDYKGVNVQIETDWSSPEKISNVDVYIEFDKQVPVNLHLIGENNHCDIRIISGMSAKIIDSETGKILAVIKGPEESKKK